MPVLLNERTPGIQMTPELRARIPGLIDMCKAEGLDPFKLVYDVFSYDEIAEIVAYTGFPVRYPHYKFGESYEELARGQEYGFQKVYELVVNCDPCYVYLLENNTMVDQLTVIVHALAHSDFFKNNIFFSKTNRNMLNEMASHGTRIRRYSRKFGRDRVTNFLDCILSIADLIDPVKIWSSKRYQQPQIQDKVDRKQPDRIRVDSDSSYMDKFINPKKFLEEQRKRISDKTTKKEEVWPEKGDVDILGFLMNYAPLKQWQRDVIGMVREESYYFLPQRMTKIVNEGWASYWDSHMMSKKNIAQDAGIIDYAIHKAGTLGGKYSSNPYKLGYLLFQYIEECYDKGRVPGVVHPEWGIRWEDCKDREQRENWDLKWGKGREKIFDVRARYNDALLIQEFMTQDFCDDYEYFTWERNRKGEYVIVTRDAKEISRELINRLDNMGKPVIKLVNANAMNRGYIELQHKWLGREIDQKMAKLTLQRVRQIWRRPVYLRTKVRGQFNGEPNDTILASLGEGDIFSGTPEEFEKKVASKKS